YGGDEFCVIMPESDRITCLRFMNRLKHKIAGSRFPVPQLGKDLSCTVSQGGAVFPDNGINSEQLVFAADMALLHSKEKGRNQYHLFEK
ncbi:diguanylate cyclase, partial [candidate division GN15 bacterium]|nr:diguanylate cyclase [candidate division GN15 bacterium]